MADEKKIIIDEDWKEQAKREKEMLAAEKKIEEQKRAAESEEAPDRGPLPAANMSGLISMLGTQAFFAMGAFAAEEGEEPQVDLEMAKYSIDMLGVIEEKTKGNLTEDESGTLAGTLHQLRMAYVNVLKKSDQG